MDGNKEIKVIDSLIEKESDKIFPNSSVKTHHDDIDNQMFDVHQVEIGILSFKSVLMVGISVS